MLPLRAVPARFEARRLYDEDFVVAMRGGHVFARTPTLPAFCRAQHLLVSLDGTPRGFVDELLAKRGLDRRIVLTVPTFMIAPCPPFKLRSDRGVASPSGRAPGSPLRAGFRRAASQVPASIIAALVATAWIGSGLHLSSTRSRRAGVPNLQPEQHLALPSGTFSSVSGHERHFDDVLDRSA